MRSLCAISAEPFLWLHISGAREAMTELSFARYYDGSRCRISISPVRM